MPGKEGCWSRRYSCFSCDECKTGAFQDCENDYAGEWVHHDFHLKKKHDTHPLWQYFDDLNYWKKKKKDGSLDKKITCALVNQFLAEKFPEKKKKEIRVTKANILQIWEKLGLPVIDKK